MFVVTPPEKQKKLDDWARKARFVGYVNSGKGWMLWDQAKNKILYSKWVQFADKPLRPIMGEHQIPENLDPKLLRKEKVKDRIGNVLNPALCQQASALCFVMACKIGDFTAEKKVQSQEDLINQLAKQTISPTSLPPKKYKDMLKHPDCYAADSASEDGNSSTLTEDLSPVSILSYLAVGTWPDIAFAVNYMARFSANPSPDHWKALRHVVNYMAHTGDDM
ncbi:hypothetical protein PCANC_17525 [Puccinia coronata f. sp. avenae]|uniref:Retroviral polymerase SH3-like domain-containing protein n=1 Tax=Puccinia coronata f. sp. avenae TaxID=200324 RepID=A0A2N5STZ5_9BASI|nr:hypothetical protein PCANC_17525 [Puccinia coronata f. sp. avenae]